MFQLNCEALDEVSTTPMLAVDASETLAALAGVMPRGSDASATAAVPAKESLRRLVWGTTAEENKRISLDLPNAYAKNSILTNHRSQIRQAIDSEMG